MNVLITTLKMLKTPNSPFWCTYSQVSGAGNTEHQAQETVTVAVVMPWSGNGSSSGSGRTCQRCHEGCLCRRHGVWGTSLVGVGGLMRRKEAVDPVPWNLKKQVLKQDLCFATDLLMTNIEAAAHLSQSSGCYLSCQHACPEHSIVDAARCSGTADAGLSATTCTFIQGVLRAHSQGARQGGVNPPTSQMRKCTLCL